MIWWESWVNISKWGMQYTINKYPMDIFFSLHYFQTILNFRIVASILFFSPELFDNTFWAWHPITLNTDILLHSHYTIIKIKILILIHHRHFNSSSLIHHHLNLTSHQISPTVPKISFINKWSSLKTMHCHLFVMLLYLFQSELGPRLFLIFMMLTLTKTVGQLFYMSIWISLLVHMIQLSLCNFGSNTKNIFHLHLYYEIWVHIDTSRFNLTSQGSFQFFNPFHMNLT